MFNSSLLFRHDNPVYVSRHRINSKIKNTQKLATYTSVSPLDSMLLKCGYPLIWESEMPVVNIEQSI